MNATEHALTGALPGQKSKGTEATLNVLDTQSFSLGPCSAIKLIPLLAGESVGEIRTENSLSGPFHQAIGLAKGFPIVQILR